MTQYTTEDIYFKSFESQYDFCLDDETQALVSRLDGRAFHTFTRKCEKPFDNKLKESLESATEALCKEFHPLIAYHQSDEISIIFILKPKATASDFPFGGRLNKLNSVFSSIVASVFNKKYNTDKLATFDCRTFQLEYTDIIPYLKWRQHDCYKNAINQIALSKFSHYQLLNVNTKQKIEMLKNNNVSIEHYHPKHIYGTLMYPEKIELTIKDLERLPEKHQARLNPDLTFYRTTMTYQYCKVEECSYLKNKLGTI